MPTVEHALPCKRCGVRPAMTLMSTGGRKIGCSSCGTEYWHQDYTEEQLVRIWNYRQSVGREEDEGLPD